MKNHWILLTFLSVLTFESQAFAIENSFTPTSIYVPLRAVYLAGVEREKVATLYQCPSDNPDDCMINISDPQVLAGILNVPHEAAEGSYHQLTVQTCKDEGLYHAKIKGSVQLNGTTYYTSSGTDPLTTDIQQNDFVQLTFYGCQRQFELPSLLEVKESESFDVSLFIPLTDIAWARLGPSIISSGCVQDVLGLHSVCMGYPDVTPYVGKTEPKLEVYSIYEPPAAPDTAAGRVLLLFDANDGWIGGTTRRLYSATSVDAHGNYDTPIWIFEQNSDGTLHLENFGSTGDTSYLIFPSFTRASHIGSFISNNWGGATFTYGAVKQ